MKKFYKFAFVILALIFMSSLISCFEIGGTIIVKNNYSNDKEVTVYSDFSPSSFIFTYKDKYGPITIIAGSTDCFNVNSDSTYGIIWRDGSVNKYKKIEVSNGNTVEVTIP